MKASHRLRAVDPKRSPMPGYEPGPLDIAAFLTPENDPCPVPGYERAWEESRATRQLGMDSRAVPDPSSTPELCGPRVAAPGAPIRALLHSAIDQHVDDREPLHGLQRVQREVERAITAAAEGRSYFPGDLQASQRRPFPRTLIEVSRDLEQLTACPFVDACELAHGVACACFPAGGVR